MPWKWNAPLKRYIETVTGQILSFDDVQNKVDDWIADGESNVIGYAALLADGKLSIQDWLARMIREIKSAHIEQAELAGGGRPSMTQADWGSIGSLLKFQYQKLKGFAEAIDTGHLTASQIASRSSMYINSSRASFWRIRGRRERALGMTQELWIAIGDKNTCSPCFEADAMGWQPIGTFGEPGSGVVRLKPRTQCEGLTRCRCRLQFRKEK